MKAKFKLITVLVLLNSSNGFAQDLARMNFEGSVPRDLKAANISGKPVGESDYQLIWSLSRDWVAVVSTSLRDNNPLDVVLENRLSLKDVTVQEVFNQLRENVEINIFPKRIDKDFLNKKISLEIAKGDSVRSIINDIVSGVGASHYDAQFSKIGDAGKYYLDASGKPFVFVSILEK